MTAEMETDLSGTPGGAQLRKQEAEMVGSGERVRLVACVQNYTGNRKQQWLCILGQVLGAAAQGAVPESRDRRAGASQSCVSRLTNPRAESLEDFSCIC